ASSTGNMMVCGVIPISAAQAGDRRLSNACRPRSLLDTGLVALDRARSCGRVPGPRSRPCVCVRLDSRRLRHFGIPVDAAKPSQDGLVALAVQIDKGADDLVRSWGRVGGLDISAESALLHNGGWRESAFVR